MIAQAGQEALQRWLWVGHTDGGAGQIFKQRSGLWELTVARKVLDAAVCVNDDFLDGILQCAPGYMAGK